MHALKNVETSGTRLTTPASLLPSASFPVLSLSFIILTQVHALRQPGESSLCETGNWTCALLLGYSDVPSGYSAHEPPTIPCEAANATYLKGSICALTFGMFHAVDLSSLVEMLQGCVVRADDARHHCLSLPCHYFSLCCRNFTQPPTVNRVQFVS
ncbi:uncharacterized protein LOC125516703 isoform X2 [Triticum urartu]|uniref:uncharacterized protein LOC125516703 isoform X2 n=1 Tax=Triticum urartu TaxID=4572 RepID=UPI0020449F14|nr:uncharacterized protein LOC125516703 isoform X2 [Triticum urartu]